MRVQRIIMASLVFSILTFGRQNGFSQGFVNLDFEHPILPLNPVNSQVSIGNGLPGWTGYGGTIQLNPADKILYNTLSLGSAAISLQGPGSLEPILQGSYSVILQGSTGAGPVSAAIGQTGQIPANAESVLFFAASFSSFQVTFAGTPISLFKIGSSANYDTVAGDISMFAGSTGELRFTALPNNSGILDNIQFSTNPIPEPETWALMLCGAVLFGVGRWKQGRLRI